MTKTRRAKWLIPAVAALVLAMAFGAVPVLAAEGDGTTGETQASVNFTAGELKLLSTPNLDFGSHPISDKEMVYEAKDVANGMQVSDLRGSGSGWDLTATLSAFKLEGGGDTLKAASISLTNPSVAGVNGNSGTAPTPESPVVLTSDGMVTPILKAGAGAGMGAWNLNWADADIKLTVKPGTAQQGKSVATLNWTLQSTP